ncbi:MAG: hypothetical protein WCL39_08075, partial [Armatimonadota bacterium]
SDSERNACVAFDGSRYLVVWTNKRLASSEHDVWGCFVTKNGAHTTPFLVSQTPSPRGQNPMAVVFGKTAYLVVWNKDVGSGYPSPIEWDVQGRLVSPSGAFLTPEFAVTSAAGSQGFPRAAFDGTRYMVAWTDITKTPAGVYGGSIYGRFLADSGTPEGSEFPIYLGAGPLLAFPLAGGGGRFLLGYMEGDVLSGAPSSLYGLLVSAGASTASGIKSNPDGTRVALTNKVVTSIETQPSEIVYVQEPDRSSGIRVSPDSLPNLNTGDVVTVYGDLSTTDDGERVITGATITPTGSMTAPIPLKMINRSVSGGDWQVSGTAGQRGVTGGKGLNNIGLLVRTAGSFTYVDNHTLTIEDGSGATITCQTPSTVLANPAWKHVTVTGISSIRKSGEVYNRLLRVTAVDSVVAAPPEGVTGRWEATNTTGAAPGVFGMLLVQQGSVVTGSAFGCVITGGQVSGNVFTCSFVLERFDDTITSSLTLDGDTLSGTWTNGEDGSVYPLTFHKVSSDPISPYVGRPNVLVAACDGASIDVTWDRPVNGWDFDIRDQNGNSIVTDRDGAGSSYDPVTHVFRIPVPVSTVLPPGATYTIRLEGGDPDVDWRDPYGVEAWDTDASAYSFTFTVPGEITPEAPSFVIGFVDGSPPAQVLVRLIANWPAGATSMQLHQSSDKVNWVPTSIPVSMVEGDHAVAEFEQSSNAYFRFTAIGSGGESAPSDIIHARPSEVERGGVSLDSPAPEGASDVSLAPIFAWHKDWLQSATLKYYECEVHPESPWGTSWVGVTTSVPPATSVVYGQTSGMLTLVPAVPLASYALYQCNVYAVDNENWAFATSGGRHFWTGQRPPDPF